MTNCEPWKEVTRGWWWEVSGYSRGRKLDCQACSVWAGLVRSQEVLGCQGGLRATRRAVRSANAGCSGVNVGK